MPPAKISEINNAFFIFGYLDQIGSSEIYSRVQAHDEPGWFTWNMLTLDLARKYGQYDTNRD